MSDIVVRKARKDYVCDCCGHVIKAGTEYLDKCIIIHGTPVKHERYHDECPDEGLVMRLWRRILKEDGEWIVADKDGAKQVIYGIAKISGQWCVNAREFAGITTTIAKGRYVSINMVKEWHDENGNPLGAKNLQND